MTGQALTIAGVFRPRAAGSAFVYDFGLIAAGSFLIALSAQLAFWVPFSTVPVTGQTFAVLMLGALLGYVRSCDPTRFQPMNANFGLVPPLEERVRDKRRRREALVERAVAAIDHFATSVVGVPA